MDVGGNAPVHIHAQIEGLVGVFRIGQGQARLALPLADEGVLVRVGNRQAGDDERRTGRYHLQRLDFAVGMGVPPRPEEVAPGIVARNLGLAAARVTPCAAVAPHLHLALVRERDERLAAQRDMGDFKTLADGYAHLFAAR